MDTEKDSRRIVRIKAVYGTALALIALTIIASSLLMQYMIRCNSGDSRVINLSGRQRMLSQRLTKCVLALARDIERNERGERLRELRESFASWEKAHHGLQHGDASLGLPGRELSPTVVRLFKEIEPYHAAMAAALRSLPLTTVGPPVPTASLTDSVSTMLANEGKFLVLMDKITFEFDREARQRVESMRRLEGVLLAVGLSILAMEFLLVFRPSILQLSRMMNHLREANKRLQESLRDSLRLMQVAEEARASAITNLELSQNLTRELKEAQSELVATARQAGMAEIATNVLHNVGNVLNSVNVSAEVAAGTLRGSSSLKLAKAVQLITEHAGDLGAFLADDERGRLLPAYLERLSLSIEMEREGVLAELARLTTSINHIKEIVHTQQSYAGSTSLVEGVSLFDLVQDALRMSGEALKRHGVQVVSDIAELSVLQLDRGRVLQILVNLINNAKQALQSTEGTRLVVVRAVVIGDGVRIEVRDTGEGIAPENLSRIFNHGFTTRKGGHGFGLHSCALAAKEMGGTLGVTSDGVGKGATFTLELPLFEVNKSVQLAGRTC